MIDIGYALLYFLESLTPLEMFLMVAGFTILLTVIALIILSIYDAIRSYFGLDVKYFRLYPRNKD